MPKNSEVTHRSGVRACPLVAQISSGSGEPMADADDEAVRDLPRSQERLSKQRAAPLLDHSTLRVIEFLWWMIQHPGDVLGRG